MTFARILMLQRTSAAAARKKAVLPMAGRLAAVVLLWACDALVAPSSVVVGRRPPRGGLAMSAQSARSPKYIVVTGGVISGIGKGVTASSIGVCMKMLGARVTAVKIDPYLNVDAGTMSPLEHGECFVLDDGGETDLDLGNYERFLDVILGSDSNLTTGKIYKRVIERERAGEYLGKTVQIIPHSTARRARTRGVGCSQPGRGRLLTRLRSALHSHQRDHGSHLQRGAQPDRRERRAAAHLHHRAG